MQLRVVLALFLLGASSCTLACASVRATGPKTSVDRCVDRCDEAERLCGHPTYPSTCSIEYDRCVLECDAKL